MRFAKSFFVFAFYITSILIGKSESVLGIEGENHSDIGIYIKDIKNNVVIFESDADRCMTPASITKLYTSATAMSLLPSDFRFETKVYLTGEKGSNGAWNGNIVVKASGDPTLESEHFPKNKGFINDIIKALENKGITKINGDVILARVNEKQQYQEGPLSTWCIDDVCWAYGCGIFDFNWLDNYVGVFPATGKTTSPVPGLKCTVWTNPWEEGLDMIRGIYSDSLIVVGKKYATDRKAKVNTSMPYPFDVFKAMLVEKLKSNNISITQKTSASTERTHLVTHYSPKIDDILRSLMVRSDNMFAEGMLRVLGNRYGDTDASLKAENDLWKSRGLEPEYNRVLDGSGLSRADAISARFLGNVLEWMANSDMQERYTKLFPVAGYDGTMKSYLSDTPLKGRLALKTGSLNSVQSYAGYMVDANGKPTHVVVIMANNFFCSRKELRNAIQEMLLDNLSPCI